MEITKKCKHSIVQNLKSPPTVPQGLFSVVRGLFLLQELIYILVDFPCTLNQNCVSAIHNGYKSRNL